MKGILIDVEDGESENKALNDIFKEYHRQDEKWGAKRDYENEVWLAIISEEVGELSEAMLHKRFGGPEADNIRTEAVQIAAVMLQFIEALDRRK